jgi:hypothetical protein
MQRIAFLEQSKVQTMSQIVTLPATQSLAVEALARNDHVEVRSRPCLCTVVDRRSQKALKTAIPATLGHPSGDYQGPKVDSQVVPCEANQTYHRCSWAFLIPREYRCTETATPIPAPCSLSQSDIPYPDYPAAKPSKGRATQCFSNRLICLGLPDVAAAAEAKSRRIAFQKPLLDCGTRTLLR